MRSGLQTSGWLFCVAGLLLVFANDASADIEAVKGKQYRITKRHGPWMIMVATFHAPPKDRRGKGMTPEQAADELVYELRKTGIPAYPFQLNKRLGEVWVPDRTGQTRRRHTTYRGGVAVLAGNYGSPKEKLAQATLEYIKKFRPKFLTNIDGKNKIRDGSTVYRTKEGGLYRSTPGQPYPFGGAHLTPNPLLSPEELHARRRDPLIIKLNSGNDYSLLDNPGKYTLIVKTFYGKSITGVSGKNFERKINKFKVTDSLDQAGQNAWEMAMALRKHWKQEAYVYHLRDRSIVTVGAFDSPSDPRVHGRNGLIERYKAKYRNDPNSGRRVLVAEGLTIPPKPAPGEKLQRQWVFDPQPRIMLVPQMSR